jgi:uncharacterized protein (DUF302 family)
LKALTAPASPRSGNVILPSIDGIIGDLKGTIDMMNSTGQGARASSSAEGVITRPSPYSVDDTVSRIEATLRARGLTLFALVDHSGEAERVGLTMRPTKLLIFGSPTAGTPLMIASPLLALDLPLKALVWQDAAGQVLVSYNSTAYLAARHHIPDTLLPNIAGIDVLIASALAH